VLVTCWLEYRKSLLLSQEDAEMEVEAYLRRKYEATIKAVEIVHREDLDLVRWVYGFMKISGNHFGSIYTG
jgi:hypothetical protein